MLRGQGESLWLQRKGEKRGLRGAEGRVCGYGTESEDLGGRGPHTHLCTQVDAGGPTASWEGAVRRLGVLVTTG